MIDVQYDQIVIECDGCSNVHEGGSKDWKEVWPHAKHEGWKSRKIGNEWVHLCPRCTP